MKHLLLTIVCLIAWTTLPVQDMRQDTYCNPLNIDYTYMIYNSDRDISYRSGADPAVVEFRGEYYMFVTRSHGYWRSRDLLNWEFVRPGKNWYPQGCNAPAAHNYKDSVLYVAGDPSGSMSILYTDDPASGDWEATPAILHNLQDPDLFIDDDGKAYMFWGSSNVYPIRGMELDKNHRFTKKGETKELFNLDMPKHGWERFGGYWWLAKTCLFLAIQTLIIQSLTKFCSVRQIPDGTKTGQNHRKIKSRTPCSEYPYLNICYSGAKVRICPVKNESKRIKFTSIAHFLFSCTTVDNTNRFLPRLNGLASKSRVKICFVASDSHVRRKCGALYGHSARSFAGKRNPCSLKHRKLAEPTAGKVSGRPTDNLLANGGKSRQMKELNIYKSTISR
jgi:Beta-xylosidase